MLCRHQLRAQNSVSTSKDWLDTKGQLLIVGLRNSYPQEQTKKAKVS